jgi:hypothetical protein
MDYNPSDINRYGRFDETFFRPALTLLHDYCRAEKTDGALPDALFIRLSLRRCLDHYDSGRDFLQELADRGEPLARATFFDALHQPRRLAIVAEVVTRLAAHAAEELVKIDWLASVPGLADREVWAVDGHQIEHACHAVRDAKQARVPPGCIFALDLHQGLMHALDAHQGDGRRTHEIKAFRACLPAHVARKRRPRRPIIIGDMAYIDNSFWTRLRLGDANSPVLITRQKDNMKPVSYGSLPFDPADPLNAGVLDYEMVGFDNALNMWRVTYKDPENGAEFVFLTSDGTLLPGVVALLYRLRWKIEKTFNTFKSKLHLTKAWANGNTAQELQAHFSALTHNLLALLLHRLDADHDITEQKLVVRHEVAADARTARGIPHHPFYFIAKLALQLSCQFIRLVRTLLRRPILWREALPLFKLRLAAYI